MDSKVDFSREDTCEENAVSVLGENSEGWDAEGRGRVVTDPTILKNVAEVELATAFANSVLPVPGCPYRMTPFGA